MIKIDLISDTLIIIGNGFDRNLGLKTGYEDFIRSHYFTNLLANNELAKWLNAKAQLKNWIDIESELSHYSKRTAGFRLSKNEVKEDYLALKKALKEYLTTEIKTNELKEDSFAWTFIMRLLENTDFTTKTLEDGCLPSRGTINAVSFNYTDTIERLPELKPKNPLDIGITHDVKRYFGEIKYMHGKLSGSDIVFGVEDGADFNSNLIFLLKARQMQDANGRNKTYDINDLLSKSKNIIFIGYSLGQTDHHYFKNFFTACTNGTLKNKKIFFTAYNEEAEEDIAKMIYEITDQKLQELQNKIHLEFVDVNNAQFEIKGKQYNYPAVAKF